MTSLRQLWRRAESICVVILPGVLDPIEILREKLVGSVLPKEFLGGRTRATDRLGLGVDELSEITRRP